MTISNLVNVINDGTKKISNLILPHTRNTGKRKINNSGFRRMALFCLLVFLIVISVSTFVLAAPAEEQAVAGQAMDSISIKAISAAVAIGLGAAAAAIAMGIAISKSSESIARQPEAEGSIRTTLLLGLVFIETAIIYVLVIAIMIIFVL
ncbi:MAG TPA: ATP synthase F0 subunit C [Acetivibrio sp.]|nr:ATP synthase F0 subunit C [Acetivibrio sp.]